MDVLHVGGSQKNLGNVSASEVHAQSFNNQEVSHEENPSFTCADGAPKLFDLPRLHRCDILEKNLLLDEDGHEAETICEEANGKTLRSMSGGLYRNILLLLRKTLT